MEMKLLHSFRVMIAVCSASSWYSPEPSDLEEFFPLLSSRFNPSYLTDL